MEQLNELAIFKTNFNTVRFIKKIFWSLVLLFLSNLVYINIKLYANDFTKQETESDIICQLNFLTKEIKNNNLGDRMQNLFPEGFVFANVLYGLSWCEVGIFDSLKKTEALNEALFAFNEINTQKAKAIFNSNTQTDNGIFYLGWNNYLLSKILMLDTNFSNSKALIKVFKEQSDLIIDALNKSNIPFLQSYPNQCWPADMCVAMASVSNYNKIFEAKYNSDIANWVKNVKLKLDPKTLMLPHKVNAINGATIEGARGCSQSLIIRLLAEIDTNFAKGQFELYQQSFVSTTFGLPSINEYPKGQKGNGDIDSGPVIFGVGFAGTIVSIVTFAVLGCNNTATNQYKTINAFGYPFKWHNTKQYLFGQLPIADAFIAWGRSSGLNYDESSKFDSDFWRLKFHAVTVLIILFFAVIYFFRIILNSSLTFKL